MSDQDRTLTLNLTDNPTTFTFIAHDSTLSPVLIVDSASYDPATRVTRGEIGGYEDVSDSPLSSHPIPHTVALKWASSEDEVDQLRWEHGVYTGHLQALQGIIVPICYGLYVSTADDTPLACLVLEWCESIENPAEQQDLIELNRQKMVAAYHIHHAGVRHNLLHHGRHYLQGLADENIRVVDFQTAELDHECPGASPLLIVDGKAYRQEEGGCLELEQMEDIVGRIESGEYKTSLSELIKQARSANL